MVNYLLNQLCSQMRIIKYYDLRETIHTSFVKFSVYHLMFYRSQLICKYIILYLFEICDNDVHYCYWYLLGLKKWTGIYTLLNSSNPWRGVYLYTIHITFIQEFIQLVLPLDIIKIEKKPHTGSYPISNLWTNQSVIHKHKQRIRITFFGRDLVCVTDVKMQTEYTNFERIAQNILINQLLSLYIRNDNHMMILAYYLSRISRLTLF